MPDIRLNRRHCLALLGSSGLPATVLAAPPPAAPAAVAAVSLAPLPLRERRLANGLQVVSVASALSSSVSVQVWYRVGGKDDPVGRSGFAHLFEHMMFKRTRYMPNEMFDRLTEDVGGQNNAFTAEDVTAYQNEVPSNHLERLLWAEAERLAHLQVDQGNFDSERKVVIEELRQRVLADPYGRLFNALPQYGFEQHPYRRPVIGNEAELNAATLDDVQRFHSTYYRPDNALLIVVGDFDPPQLDAWVDRYFGRLATPSAPIPRVSTAELPRAQDGRATLHAPNVPLPAVALLWKAPPARHADAAALTVASALLSGGESSRLNEALVYRAQAAQAAGSSADLYADAGLFTAYAIAPAELDKVRTQLLTAALAGRQTPQGQAQAIGQAVLLHGDARAADRDLQRLQAVSAADVQAALQRWVLGSKRMTVQYSQGAGA